jgi:hypothetical protein
MAWWHKFLPATGRASPAYSVAFVLYSRDGKRGSEVRVRRDGSCCFVDQEWVEGTTFRWRGSAEEIGPYPTTDAAEAAAVSRPWFHGEQSD